MLYFINIRQIFKCLTLVLCHSATYSSCMLLHLDTIIDVQKVLILFLITPLTQESMSLLYYERHEKPLSLFCLTVVDIWSYLPLLLLASSRASSSIYSSSTTVLLYIADPQSPIAHIYSLASYSRSTMYVWQSYRSILLIPISNSSSLPREV